MDLRIARQVGIASLVMALLPGAVATWAARSDAPSLLGTGGVGSLFGAILAAGFVIAGLTALVTEQRVAMWMTIGASTALFVALFATFFRAAGFSVVPLAVAASCPPVLLAVRAAHALTSRTSGLAAALSPHEIAWEWQLSKSLRILARFDRQRGTETVSLNDRVISRAEAGRPEGHPVDLIEAPSGSTLAKDVRRAVVDFVPAHATCSLRLVRDGAPDEFLAPTIIHTGQGPFGATLPKLFPIALALTLFASTAVTVSVIGQRARAATGEGRVPTDGATFQSPNKLFTLHSPPSFSLREHTPDDGFDGLLLHRPGRREALIGVFATEERPPADISEFTWQMVRRMTSVRDASFYADPLQVPNVGAETSHPTTAGQCLGDPGVQLQGTVQSPHESVHLWSCAFQRGERTYFAFYALSSSRRAADEDEVRQILDATEIADAPAPAIPAVEPADPTTVRASCVEGHKSCSADGTEVLECRHGKLMVTYRSCLGARGCREDAESLECDQSIAKVNEACVQEGRLACATDGKAVLWCSGGVFAVSEKCRRGACTVEHDVIACDADAKPR